MFTKRIVGYQRERLAKVDARLKVINEVFAGIEVVKYNVYEPAFAAKMKAMREEVRGRG